MFLTTPKETIRNLLMRQLESNFEITEEEKGMNYNHLDGTIAACDVNFSHSSNKYFTSDIDGVITSKFNPYHSVQWMIFLYYLSHLIYKSDPNGGLCDKIYYLNKILHSVDLFLRVVISS